MTQQIINVGAAIADGTGDPARTAYTKCNDNFTELYAGIPGAPQHGRLYYTSATQLSFKPYNGDRIKINGVIYAIPSAGIAGVANTSVFVNGTAGQNLAADTTYLVCAFSNAGTITADFRTTLTHAPSATVGNVGVEIPTGLDTRTVIGMIRTNASSQFLDQETNRQVISWFNRRNRIAIGASTNNANSTSTTMIEITSASRAYWITWSDEQVLVTLSGVHRNNTTGSVVTDVGLDGTATLLLLSAFADVTGGIFYSCGAALGAAVAEGLHYTTPVGAIVNVGGGIWSVVHSVLIRG